MTTLASDFPSIQISSVTWSEEKYDEAKAILENIDHHSLDQLEHVFNLANLLTSQNFD